MIDLWLRSARVSSSSNILFSSPQSGQNTPVMLHPRYLVRASRRDCLHILTCPLSTQKIRMSCVLLLSLDTTAPSFPIYMDSESLAEVVVCRERTMTLWILFTFFAHLFGDPFVEVFFPSLLNSISPEQQIRMKRKRISFDSLPIIFVPINGLAYIVVTRVCTCLYRELDTRTSSGWPLHLNTQDAVLIVWVLRTLRGLWRFQIRQFITRLTSQNPLPSVGSAASLVLFGNPRRSTPPSWLMSKI